MKFSKGFIVFLVVLFVGLVALMLIPFIKTHCGPTHDQSRTMSEAAGLRNAVRQFQNEYNAYPTGTAREVFEQLTSNNVRRIPFLEAAASSLNSAGEFCDPWDTPYQITISPTNVAVRSAGPDGKSGTRDDIAIP